ncbi:Tryptophan synthase alpha chain [Capillimicrobium parvum]|uniref:Tryptophan synthase alpha chain n=2 Tax=Capillimicrobium parvum TaxID=2884022 RepID=A0A9E7C2I6_9ACTN|nr:Tryptophan synthase alpha chain [Capillimicrobium parvum]
MTGIEHIAAAFAGADKRAALMPYLMGGFPDLDTSRRIGDACIDAGADLLELGIPFSDPLADGPVIQAAGTAALAAGATTDGVLEVCAALAPRAPVVLMTYVNILLARGIERFVDQAARAGAAGLIVPDVPLEESAELRDACDAAGLALVALVAPTTPDDRLARIGALARGFVYTVAVTGTTGERRGGDASELLARVKRSTSVPVALGFGISTPEDAARAAADGADGVIVGSRLVRAAAEAQDPATEVGRLVAELAAGLAAPPAHTDSAAPVG